MRAMWRRSKAVLAVLLALGMVTSGTDLTVFAEGAEPTAEYQEADMPETQSPTDENGDAGETGEDADLSGGGRGHA